MPSIGVDRLERRLLALDHDTFAAFVAALWTASGWSTTRDGPLLEVASDGETRRLYVLPPRRLFPDVRPMSSVPEDVEAVVAPYRSGSTGVLPRGLPQCEVIDATDLRERLVYGIDGDARERLLAEYGIGDESPHRVLPAVITTPRRDRVAAGGIGVALLVVGLLVLLSTSGVFAGGGGASATVNISEPQPTGTYATAEDPVYGAQPTCDRSPREVVRVTSAALRGPNLDRGLVVAGRFWNPRAVRGSPTGIWNRMMREEVRQPYYNATFVTFPRQRIQGDSATVHADVITGGEQRVYVFELSRNQRFPPQGCWVIDGFGPAEDR